MASASALGDGAWPAVACRASPPAGSTGACPTLIDCAIAAGCFAAFTLPVLAGAASRIGSPLAVAVFGVLAAAPLIVRRRWPLASVAVITAVYVAATLVGVRFTPFVSNAGPNFAIAVFTAADRCGRRVLADGRDRGRGRATWAVLPLGIGLHPGQDQDAVQLLAVDPGLGRSATWCASAAATGSGWSRRRVAARRSGRRACGPRNASGCPGTCTMWCRTA